jgi:hypothetical protein
MPDPSNESGTNSEEPPDDTEAHREYEPGTSPHHRQSASFMAFLIQLGAPEVCQRILDGTLRRERAFAVRLGRHRRGSRRGSW